MQHGAYACFQTKHTSGEALDNLRRVGEGRGPVDVNNRFPACAAVIGAHQNSIVTTAQACQFLNRMLTERFALLFPLRVDVRVLGL